MKTEVPFDVGNWISCEEAAVVCLFTVVISTFTAAKFPCTIHLSLVTASVTLCEMWCWLHHGWMTSLVVLRFGQRTEIWVSFGTTVGSCKSS